MLGERSNELAASIAGLGVIYFIARWIGLWLFPVSEHLAAPLMLTEGQRRQGRLLSNLLGFFVGALKSCSTISGEKARPLPQCRCCPFP